MIGSPCCPRDSQEFSLALQFESVSLQCSTFFKELSKFSLIFYNTVKRWMKREEWGNGLESGRVMPFFHCIYAYRSWPFCPLDFQSVQIRSPASSQSSCFSVFICAWIEWLGRLHFLLYSYRVKEIFFISLGRFKLIIELENTYKGILKDLLLAHIRRKKLYKNL